MPHTHIVKVLHRLLPTHAQANKFDGGNRRCTLCGSLQEDHSHIIRCKHANRLAWRNAFLTSLRNFCLQSNTSPLLSVLLLNGIRQWFSSSTTDITLLPKNYHPTLQQIVRQQNKIGWAQIFSGRFGKAWSADHQKNYATNQSGSDYLDHSSSVW